MGYFMAKNTFLVEVTFKGDVRPCSLPNSFALTWTVAYKTNLQKIRLKNEEDK